MPIRALRAEELAEVEKVFSTGLDVTRVRINENASLPDLVGRIGAKLRGAAAARAQCHHAGQHLLLPRHADHQRSGQSLVAARHGLADARVDARLAVSTRRHHLPVPGRLQIAHVSVRARRRISRRRAEGLQQSGQGLPRLQPRAAGRHRARLLLLPQAEPRRVGLGRLPQRTARTARAQRTPARRHPAKFDLPEARKPPGGFRSGLYFRSALCYNRSASNIRTIQRATSF